MSTETLEIVPAVTSLGRHLRAAGLPVTTTQLSTLVAALGHVEVGDPSDVRLAARLTLVSRREDLERFDALWSFWVAGARRSDAVPAAAPRPAFQPALAASAGSGGEDPGERRLEPVRRAVYSPAERLRRRDFAELDAGERREVERAIDALGPRLERRRTRRWQPARGGPEIDLRRSLARSARTGELLSLARRRRKERPRPLVALCDVSGSMELYSRLLLRFLYTLGRAHSRVEAFAFGTRLTRLTRQLEGRQPDRALAAAAREVVDWGGGTRIGACLHELHRRWGRQVLGGSTVLLISDGWDRGPAAQLEREMERLRRRCRRLIWLNPLLGSPGYQPLTRGLVAALPHVDLSLSVRNLDSLEELARVLSSARPGAAREAGRRAA